MSGSDEKKEPLLAAHPVIIAHSAPGSVHPAEKHVCFVLPLVRAAGKLPERTHGLVRCVQAAPRPGGLPLPDTPVGVPAEGENIPHGYLFRGPFHGCLKRQVFLDIRSVYAIRGRRFLGRNRSGRTQDGQGVSLFLRHGIVHFPGEILT